MGSNSVIDRIINAIDAVVDDYSEWSAWGSIMDGHKAMSGELHHEWNCESEIAARVILQYLKDRGMAVKAFPDSPPDSIWIHVEKRKNKRNIQVI